MNHHSRYDVSQRKRRDVPEELLHGVASFREACPTAVFYLFPIPLSKNGYQKLKVKDAITHEENVCLKRNFAVNMGGMQGT